MTNHPLEDAAKFDHERASGCIPSQSAITNDQPRGTTGISLAGPAKTLDAITMVFHELTAAVERYGPQCSAHEGYAILLEEVDELWDEIKKNDKLRSKTKMLAEAKQIAAMAIRFMVDVCGEAIHINSANEVYRKDLMRFDVERRRTDRRHLFEWVKLERRRWINEGNGYSKDYERRKS